MKRFIAVFAILAGSVFVAIPAALADGDTPSDTPTTSDTPTDAPTDAPSDTPTDTPSDTPTDTPTDPPAGDAPTTGTTDPKSSLTTAKIVKVAAKKEKITICHATDSNTHPYVVNKPDKDGDVSGHADHTGPVWSSGIDTKWGDIIPPFDYPGGHFDGLNWTDAGQAIYNNGCKIPEEVVTEVAPEVPTVTPATCEAAGTLVIPETTGVDYTVDPEYTGPGDYTVSAQPKIGYTLIDDDAFPVSLTVDPRLTGSACAAPVTPSGPSGDSNGILPSTGGAPFWMLLLGAGLTAAGVGIVRRRQPVDGIPAYRLEI